MDSRPFALALILAACGPAPDYRSSHGVAYFFDEVEWSHEEIEEQETWFLTQVVSNPGYPETRVLEALEQVEVHLKIDPIPCGYSKGCNGLQDYEVLLVRAHACPFQSALTHEMAHWLQQALHGVNDYRHEEVELWKIANSRPRDCP